LQILTNYTVQHPKEINAAEMNKKEKKRNLDFSKQQIKRLPDQATFLFATFKT
jgi:hypothetical protein